MAASLRHTRQVEFCETDMAGIVHFSNYYRWMEQAEHAYFRSLGLTIARHSDDGLTLGWPRVSVNCRFFAPAKFEDCLDVEIRVQRIGVKSLTYDVLIFRGEELLAQGMMKTVCCTIAPGKKMESIEIPDEYLAVISEYQPEGS